MVVRLLSQPGDSSTPMRLSLTAAAAAGFLTAPIAFAQA
jgi:hypothetical protein